jgi:hypothetical protein
MSTNVRKTKPVDQLERHDWIHVDFDDFVDKARVAHVESYASDSWGQGAILLYRAVGDGNVHTKRFAAADPIQMLTDAEIDQAMDEERRELIFVQLAGFAEKVRRGEVPLPRLGRPVEVRVPLDSPDAVAGFAKVVDAEVRETVAEVYAMHSGVGDLGVGVDLLGVAVRPQVFAREQGSEDGETEPERRVEPTEAMAADVPKLSAAGLTEMGEQKRGALAGTTPIVVYFSFGHGQTDPRDGKKLLDHYVTVVAPTYEECRTAMNFSRFGKRWSTDYLAGNERSDGRIASWTEHEVIVAPGTDPALAEPALRVARDLLANYGRASAE